VRHSYAPCGEAATGIKLSDPLLLLHFFIYIQNFFLLPKTLSCVCMCGLSALFISKDAVGSCRLDVHVQKTFTPAECAESPLPSQYAACKGQNLSKGCTATYTTSAKRRTAIKPPSLILPLISSITYTVLFFSTKRHDFGRMCGLPALLKTRCLPLLGSAKTVTLLRCISKDQKTSNQCV
jgi:hypothetical protein